MAKKPKQPEPDTEVYQLANIASKIKTLTCTLDKHFVDLVKSSHISYPDKLEMRSLENQIHDLKLTNSSLKVITGVVFVLFILALVL